MGRTSLTFTYLGEQFDDGCEPSLSTIRVHLYRVACADHCVVVLMAFLTHAFPPRELAIQNLPGHKARMHVWEFGGILFPLHQYLQDSVFGFKRKTWLKGRELNPC